MPISLDEFVQSLSDTGILPPEEVTSLVSSFSEDRAGVDVEKLARELVRQQKLTRFQASVIFRRQSRGLRFGDYIVLDKIGSGGMGQVFKAENRRTGQTVALKLLRATYTKSQRAVARFYRESESAMRLKHKNLVSVFEAGEWNGLHFLVMELIEGCDVRSMIKEKGPLSVKSAIDVLLQAARGLEHAHEQGIVHRDIKPANLLLDAAGRLVVLDLGLARLDETDQEGEGEDAGRLTMPGTFLGTLEYVAPEQAVDAHDVDGRCDIYSLGCSLHYLLKGRPPYRGENAAQTLLAHCHEPIPDLRQEIPEIPERLAALFERMMAKKPADRVATMTEVVAELEACHHELEGGDVKQRAGSEPVAAKGASAAPASSKAVAPNAGIASPDELAAGADISRIVSTERSAPELATEHADQMPSAIQLEDEATVSSPSQRSSRIGRVLSASRSAISRPFTAAAKLLKALWWE